MLATLPSERLFQGEAAAVAELDFYKQNEQVFYPFLAYSSLGFSGGTLSNRAVVDAGFMLGIDAGFVASNKVFLHALVLEASHATFVFRSDAAGLSDYEWRFQFPYDAGFGCSSQVDATDITNSIADPNKGWGFLSVGDLSGLQPLSVGTKLFTTPPIIEQALLQNLALTFVKNVNLANDARRCPPNCCESETSHAQNTFAVAGGTALTGDLRLKPGYNATVSVDSAGNVITIGAQKGAGEGTTCVDVLVNESGMYRDPDEHGVPQCESCEDFIRSINGRTFPTNQVTISGDAGIAVEPDPSHHKIVVRFKDFSPSSSSSSS